MISGLAVDKHAELTADLTKGDSLVRARKAGIADNPHKRFRKQVLYFGKNVLHLRA